MEEAGAHLSGYLAIRKPKESRFCHYARRARVYITMGIRDVVMTDRHSIAEARRNLPTLVRSAESGIAVELTRHGEPVAVLIGRKAFERLAAGRRRFTEAYATFERDADLPTLGLDPDAVFGTVRDTMPGRDVEL